MQGKFSFKITDKPTGHHIHEDNPEGTAKIIKEFLKQFRLALNTEDIKIMK